MNKEVIDMKRVIYLLVIILLTANGYYLNAQMTFSGVFDSTVAMQAGAKDAEDFSCGIEEFANIRFQSKFRDNRGTFYGAINVFAVAGNYAKAITQMAELKEQYGIELPAGINDTSYINGENYIAGIELERLYFRINFEAVDFDGGLMRFPFGYSQVWGPTDFLNPKNPLKPDARARAVLGAGLYWYPNDDLKILGFSASPRDPFSQDGWLLGLSAEQHWSKASLQALYSYELQKDGSDQGIHRAGLSVKTDTDVSFVMDALYAYNPEEKTGLDGLSISAGISLSFFGGDLIAQAEYLYNGESSVTAYDFEKNQLGMLNEHYLYTGFTWLLNDYTNINIALISGFEESIYTPIIVLNHDLFQGALLSFSMQMPLYREVFTGDDNFNFNSTVRLRLRF
jgi:hypothetical protein